MGLTVKQFTLCSIIFLIFVAGCHGDTTLHTCPIYVSEGVHLLCDCQYLPSGTVAPGTLTIEWLNASATAQLRVDDVRREMNGRTYTCRVSLNGQPVSSVTYILQVAYGPSDSDVSILGPNPLRVDGASPVTLTCKATAVNPAPAITWSGIQCSEGYTAPNCTFILSETDRGKTVKCEARNVLVQPMGAVGTARMTLDVEHPPDPPVITGYSPGRIMKTGDVLVCTIRGGRPLASMVVFRCFPPDLHDAFDTFEVDYVQSNVTVNTSLAISDLMSCVCTGSWGLTNSTLKYTNNTAQLAVTIEYVPPSTTPTIPTTTSTISTTAASPSTTSTSTTIITSTTTVTATEILSTAASLTTTSRSPATTESKPTTPVVVVTPSGVTTPSVNSTTPDSTLTSFPVAAFAGGLAGGALLVLIVIIIAVTCRQKKERDLRLTSAADFSNGSYKHTADQEFYMYDKNDYGNKDMMEITTNSPTLRHSHSNNNNNVNKGLDHGPDRALSFYTSVPIGLHSTQEASLDLNAEVSDHNPVVQAHGGAAFGDEDDTHGGAVYSVDRDEDDGTPDPSPSRKSSQRALKTVIDVGGPAGVTSSAPRAQKPRTASKKTVGFDVDVKEDDEDGDEDHDFEYNEEEFPLPPPPLPAEVVLGEPLTDPTYMNEALSEMRDVYIPASRHSEQSASMAFAVE